MLGHLGAEKGLEASSIYYDTERGDHPADRTCSTGKGSAAEGRSVISSAREGSAAEGVPLVWCAKGGTAAEGGPPAPRTIVTVVNAL